jgi:Tfp pilus assembly protein PilF
MLFDHDRTRSLFRRALRTDPTDPHMRQSYAKFLVARGDTAGAHKLYQEPLAATPDDAKLLSYYAIFHEVVLGDTQRAQELYETALSIAPRDAQVLYAYADRDLAELGYAQGLAIRGERAGWLVRYANFMWHKRGNLERARALFERALVADPEHVGAHQSYATFVRVKLMDWSLAAKVYERALTLDETNVETLAGLARLEETGLRRDERADQLYRALLSLDPHDASAALNYAGFMLCTGRVDEGRALLSRVEGHLEHPAEKLEVWFYRFAYQLDDSDLALANLAKLLAAGVRSEEHISGWIGVAKEVALPQLEAGRTPDETEPQSDT